MLRLVFLSLALLSSNAPAQSTLERAAKDELIFMGNEEPAMRQAFSQAKQTLNDFLLAAKRPESHLTGHALKVAISESANTEYFWVTSFSQTSTDEFEGEIGNEPRMVKSVRMGQRYAFSRSRVVDWTYIDTTKKKMVGNFTLCALLTKEPREQAEATRRRFKLDCAWLK